MEILNSLIFNKITYIFYNIYINKCVFKTNTMIPMIRMASLFFLLRVVKKTSLIQYSHMTHIIILYIVLPLLLFLFILNIIKNYQLYSFVN